MIASILSQDIDRFGLARIIALLYLFSSMRSEFGLHVVISQWNPRVKHKKLNSLVLFLGFGPLPFLPTER